MAYLQEMAEQAPPPQDDPSQLEQATSTNSFSVASPQSTVPASGGNTNGHDSLPPFHSTFPGSDIDMYEKPTSTQPFREIVTERIMPAGQMDSTPPFDEHHALRQQITKQNHIGTDFIPAVYNIGETLKVRLHPHLKPSNTLYISSIPPDVTDQAIVEALRDCLPVWIKTEQPVPANERVKPDIFYNWMPKSGILQFEETYNAEKALATLYNHPFMMSRGINISPYQIPLLLPPADPNTPGRSLRPLKQVFTLPISQEEDETANFMSNCPTPGELFTALRPWGSIRCVGVWADGPIKNKPVTWGARVEFWFEDEARRFEIGFGRTGSLVKGWQIAIKAENISTTIQPFLPPPVPFPFPHQRPPTTDLNHYHHLPPNLPPLQLTPGNLQHQLGIMYNHPSPVHINLPDTPPPTSFIPPWSGHYPFPTLNPQTPLPLTPLDSPATPIRDRIHNRLRSTSSRSSMASIGMQSSHASRRRTWSLTTGKALDGNVQSGLISDDGTFIPHGPGQQIRPAPSDGPGSNSASGLIDVNNLFVKNLDPDINSLFLSQQFEEVGNVVSARVMRESNGASRGYGFVSFRTPEEAAAAMTQMNGRRFGSQYLQVTLHEPRKTRHEKHAEKVAQAGQVVPKYSNGSIYRNGASPVRSSLRLRQIIDAKEEAQRPDTTDNIRMLSPADRVIEFERRVFPRVRSFSHINNIPHEFMENITRTLVSLDLALIPILENPILLNNEMTEIVQRIQQDLAQSTLNDLHAKLHHEVARIDPMEVDQVMEIMQRSLQISDVEMALANKSFLAKKYNVAKKELIRRQESEKEQSSSGMSGASSRSSTVPTLSKSVGSQAGYVRLSAEEVTLDSLVALSIKDMMRNIGGEDGTAILEKIGVAQPSEEDRKSMEEWMRKVLFKEGRSRKAEIATMIANKLDAEKMKKGKRTKVATEIVNTEKDEEALCELLKYPTLLEAKVKAFLSEPKRRAST